MWLQRPAVLGTDTELTVEPASEPLCACSLPAQCFSALQASNPEGVWGIFSLFLFFLLHGYFYPLSFCLWACGCVLQPPVPVGAGRREGWEEISATIRQMMQGLSTVHKAMLLVKPNHVSETGKGTIFHQETCGAWVSEPQPQSWPPAPVSHTDGMPSAGAGLEHGMRWSWQCGGLGGSCCITSCAGFVRI